jgi:hypothetical protein
MKVARNAPTMPSTVVKMKPLGLFGPGAKMRAMMPAMKPITMIQRIFTDRSSLLGLGRRV